MGQGITKCMLVNELVDELKKCDGSLLVRFRDGDAVLPMVYVMQHDRAGHVDVGLPYPARKRLAQIDAAAMVQDNSERAPAYRALHDELARVASEIGRVRVAGVDDTTDVVVRGLLNQARLSLVLAVEFGERSMLAKENEP